jgi:hypothetical protein
MNMKNILIIGSGSKTASFILANSAPLGPVITIENSELDQDGWALLAPFGEFPKSRLIRTDAGDTVQQNFIQVLDNAAATELLRTENSLFRKLRRALVGIPVYNDHPDLASLAPETLGANRGQKIPMGVVDSIRLGNGGVEGHFTLTPDGATAVEGGAKYISPLWSVNLIETLANGTHRVRPFKLLSVGLTPNPNISGVDSLANANANAPGATTKQKDNDMKLIAGWLLAQGAVLANAETPSETMVLEAIQKIYRDKGSEVTTLANARQAADGKVTTLEGEKTTLTTKVTALENEKTNLTTQVTTLSNSVKAERKARCEAVTDLVITQGKLELAKRDETITALANTADDKLDAAIKALTDAPVKFKVLANAAATDAKNKGGAAIGQTAQEQIFALANSDERYSKLPTWDEKWNAIKRDNPTLFEQLNQAPAAK